MQKLRETDLWLLEKSPNISKVHNQSKHLLSEPSVGGIQSIAGSKEMWSSVEVSGVAKNIPWRRESLRMLQKNLIVLTEKSQSAKKLTTVASEM